MEAQENIKDVVRANDGRRVSKSPKHRKVQEKALRALPGQAPFARSRSGLRTGSTPHFAAWKAEGELRSKLQRMKTVALAEQIEENSIAIPFALLNGGGFKTIWQVAQADLAELLAVPQMGPARLAKVETYLAGKRVPLNWTAKNGD